MPSYPIVTHKFNSACIQIDTILLTGDIISIDTANNVTDYTLSALQVNELKTNPDAIFKIGDYFLSYDIENKVLFVESLMRNNDLKSACLKRNAVSRLTLATITPPIPKQMRIPLDKYVLGENDTLLWSINGINYDLTLTAPIIESIKLNGYRTLDNHIISLSHTNYMGDHILITSATLTDIFTANSVYTNHLELYQINSNYIIPEKASVATFDTFNDILRVGDNIKCFFTNGRSLNKILTSNDLLELDLYKRISTDPDIIITVEPIYKGKVVLHKVILESKDPKDEFQRCEIIQPISEVKWVYNQIIREYVDFSADPFYDTESELLAHSRSELDHIKGRCICSLPGILDRIKYLYSLQNPLSTSTPVPPIYSAAKLQELKDELMDYKVYPCTCQLSTKQYIWDTYGPFTSDRPSESVRMYTCTPSIGAINVGTGSTITFTFNDHIQFGLGGIKFTPHYETSLTNNNIPDDALTTGTIALTYPINITAGVGNINITPLGV